MWRLGWLEVVVGIKSGREVTGGAGTSEGKGQPSPGRPASLPSSSAAVNKHLVTNTRRGSLTAPDLRTPPSLTLLKIKPSNDFNIPDNGTV